MTSFWWALIVMIEAPNAILRAVALKIAFWRALTHHLCNRRFFNLYICVSEWIHLWFVLDCSIPLFEAIVYIYRPMKIWNCHTLWLGQLSFTLIWCLCVVEFVYVVLLLAHNKGEDKTTMNYCSWCPVVIRVFLYGNQDEFHILLK